jgi:hypothetical protein
VAQTLRFEAVQYFGICSLKVCCPAPQSLSPIISGKARGRGEKAAVAKPVGTGLRSRSCDVLTLPKFVA